MLHRDIVDRGIFFILELFEFEKSDVKKLKISLNKNVLQLLRYI